MTLRDHSGLISPYMLLYPLVCLFSTPAIPFDLVLASFSGPVSVRESSLVSG